MSFDLSRLKVLAVAPFKTDAQGNILQTLDGVFILFSDEIVALLKAGLTQAQKDDLQTWVNQFTDVQCATWNVPLWAGDTKAVYCRVPAAVWADPSTPPPAKVRQYFQSLWQAATSN